MFKKVNPKQSFPKLEERIIKEWKKNKIFERSVEMRPKEQEYVFYDGPPFATGLPHYGHILAGTMKDVVPRYWTMRGHRVERVFGWDCHGLPVEYQIEKELGLNGRQDILEKMGIAAFNEECRKNVLRYAQEWEKTVERMGRWVDFKNAYRTMDTDYMESIWWVFKTLWDKGLIYEGLKPMHICPRCVTPLSNFEVGLGYKEITDPAITIKFELENEPKTYCLAWTTTPWSVLSVMGLSIKKDIEYIKIRGSDGNNYILAKKRLEEVLKNTNIEYEIIEHFTGEKLIGKKFKHVFDIYNNHPLVTSKDNVFTLVATDYTTDEEGTGIATINGAFGEDDMNAAQKNKIPIIRNVNMDGTFTEETGIYAGKFVKNENENIVKYMEEKGSLLKREKYKHSYPHCWRCESPLLNYATESWFVKVEALKQTMIESNQKIHWMPPHIKDGRFGKWLENARDWCISRNRYWGTPLPIWRCDDCKKTICLDSKKKLEELSGKKVKDLHKHFIDDITFSCEACAGTMKRIEEVLDCWFESGSMPYAQKHYPFENKKWMIDHFPADFIAEGLDQTRGWFYTLHVLATALSSDITNKGVTPAFRNIIVNGIVLAEDGNKMSKSKKNYPDPLHIFDKYGADAVRFYLMNSPVVRAEDLRFSEKGVSDVVKNVLLPIWNAYGFFVMYADVDTWQPGKKIMNLDKTSVDKKNITKVSIIHPKIKNKLDRWILSSLNRLIADATKEMDNYDLQAIKPIYAFIHDLTNWYIRRSRRRFWKSENDSDKNEAYETLYSVLKILAQLIAPWMPFISEEIYQNLTGEKSVHLSDWPEANKKMIDDELNREFEITQLIVNLGRRARLKANIKIRQPLGKIEIVLPENISHEIIADQILAIKEELNIKEIKFLSDTKKIATAFASPNARLLGPKYGKKVQEIIIEAKKGNFKKLPNGNIQVLDYELLPEEIEIGYHGKDGFDVESEQGIVVALDTAITKELKMEGMARDIIRFIQDMRKEAGYTVSDRIKVRVEGSDIIQTIIELFGEYIQKETLAASLNDTTFESDIKKECTIDEEKISIQLRSL
ncbi:isoleucine--tRNA ligase [Candidatus Peregrinibacteria bacterium]|nr:isoleucine--tRNA ligase [Candidatus Peregrinibacteria bacterium]